MSKIKFIYILSQRYSGSTLLSFLLGTHFEIATIGERRKFYVHSFEKKGVDAMNCSCGKPFPDCEHWNKIKAGLLKKIDVNHLLGNPTEFKFSDNKYLQKFYSELFKLSLAKEMPWLRKPLTHKLKEFSEFNKALVEESLQINQNRTFLDSSKVIDHLLYLSQIEAFDIKVVWLTRDPRAQVNSAIKYNKWTASEATERWKEEMKQNDFWLQKLKLNYVTLNYEALCHDPQQEMVRLLNFLDLDANAFSLNFREQTQHIMGNYNMRLGSETKITERKEWLNELSPEQIKIIESMTSEYKEYYSNTV